MRWNNGANKFAQYRVAINLQFVKNAIFERHNKVKCNKVKSNRTKYVLDLSKPVSLSVRKKYNSTDLVGLSERVKR